MSEKYTRGLLSHQDKRPQCGGFSLFAGDQFIGFVSDSDGCTDWQANAERLVACWNACDGIDTADLNAGSSVSIIQKMHDEAAKRVLAQREAAAAQTVLHLPPSQQQKTALKPLCRDCADFGPICPTTGLPCDGSGEKP